MNNDRLLRLNKPNSLQSGPIARDRKEWQFEQVYRKNSGQTPAVSTAKTSPSPLVRTNNNNNNKGKGPAVTPKTTQPSGTYKPSAGKPDLTNKLGKDGKLNAKEKKRRTDNNLCMYCGNAGHDASNCRKKAASAAKASAARIVNSALDPSMGLEN